MAFVGELRRDLGGLLGGVIGRAAGPGAAFALCGERERGGELGCVSRMAREVGGNGWTDKLKIARSSPTLSSVEDLRLAGCGRAGSAGFRVADLSGLVKSTTLKGLSTCPVVAFEGDRHSSLGCSISTSLSSSSSLRSRPLQSLSLNSACRLGTPGTAYEIACLATLLGVARTGLLPPSRVADNKFCS